MLFWLDQRLMFHWEVNYSKDMRLSELFSKTSKQIPADETSINAKLLIQAGYVDKVAAGIYTYLPLGKRVLDKIAQVVREEMDAIGGQEIFMPVLHPKASWEVTGRWTAFDVLFKVKGAAGEFALGPTHEEIVTPVAKRFISSYADLPKAVYQIQTKFRDEPRAKAGLLRGREFLMKDLYSFHANEKDLMDFYEKSKKAYQKIFKRLGLDAIETRAAGGTFSKFSDEYQVICESGEDEIIYCPGGDFAQNVEIATVKEGKECDLGHGPLKKVKTIEVGNIFPMKDKFSKTFNLTVADEKGHTHYVQMGCYGIGISRLMGAIVEVSHDERGIIWPRSVAPYQVHLIVMSDPSTSLRTSESKVMSQGKEVYDQLNKAGVEVLLDDREDVSAGEKFADADLLGIPVRLVVSKKVGEGKVEVKKRSSDKSEVVSLDAAVKNLQS